MAMPALKLDQTNRRFLQPARLEPIPQHKDMALSLTLEAAEVLEHFQWKNERNQKRILNQTIRTSRKELADVTVLGTQNGRSI